MAKVLLVEDDNNLREIFEMRLQAEGYQTVSARDGEEALSVAVKEKPDLIIADVMMPKLSGFEMLETLRQSPELKNVKSVMMTALGQAEDIARGEKMGVQKYLVKSQVTLEDFVRVVKGVTPPDQPSPNAGAQTSQPAQNVPSAAPPTPIQPAVAPTPTDDGQMTTSQQASGVQNQINNFASSSQDATPQPTASSVNFPAATPQDADGASTTQPAAPTNQT